MSEGRKSSRVQHDFMTLLAHELRGSLAPLVTASQVLRLAPPEGEERERALQIIEHQAWIMTRLVNDLQDVSRITHGELELRTERVELWMVIDSAVEAKRSLMARRRQMFEVCSPRVPISLVVDPTRLAQVFSILLDNAAHFTPKEGLITLAVEVAERELTIRVRDNGLEIPADELPRIFEPFRRVKIAAGGGGRGFDLAVAQALVELHKGSISATSDSQGNEFCVRLPLAEE